MTLIEQTSSFKRFPELQDKWPLQYKACIIGMKLDRLQKKIDHEWDVWDGENGAALANSQTDRIGEILNQHGMEHTRDFENAHL